MGSKSFCYVVVSRRNLQSTVAALSSLAGRSFQRQRQGSFRPVQISSFLLCKDSRGQKCAKEESGYRSDPRKTIVASHNFHFLILNADQNSGNNGNVLNEVAQTEGLVDLAYNSLLRNNSDIEVQGPTPPILVPLVPHS
jgi:hypothetical protein